jgi:hypothetical protein
LSTPVLLCIVIRKLTGLDPDASKGAAVD